MSEPPAFEATLRSLSNRINDESLHLGLFDEGTRVPRATIERLDPEQAFELTGSYSSDTRYRCEQTSDKTVIRQWTRHAYRVERIDDKRIGVLLVESPGGTEGIPVPPAIDEASFTTRLLRDAYRFDDVAPPASTRVAGLSKQRTRIHDFLSQRVGQWGLREGTGLLLTGPPGTGKTELVKEICEQLYGETPVAISGPEILNKWLGESEAALRRRFQEAQKSSVPVLYLDEVDALGRTRQRTDQAHTAQLVSQLLVLLDGIDTKRSDRDLPTFDEEAEKRTEANRSSLRVIASTNRPDTIDEALLRPGRLGDEVLQFGRPSSIDRRVIFHHYLSKMYARGAPLSESLEMFVTEDLGRLDAELIEDTNDFTGAEIEQAILNAAGRIQPTNAEMSDVWFTQTDLREGVVAMDRQRSSIRRHPNQASFDRF